MQVPNSSPGILLHHDGELADIRRLLEELSARFEEQIGDDAEDAADSDWNVLIASPRRMLSHRAGRDRARPTLIAVLEDSSRTLRSHLRRMSVDMMIRRPVHPAALRLLILHLLYRGPERRQRQRVTVGAPVRFRSGLLPRGATLADVSLRGCRLLSATPVARDRRLRITFPAQLAGGRAFSVKGRVVRSSQAQKEAPGVMLLAVRFDRPSARQTARLQALLDAHQAGPATLPRPAPGAATRGETRTTVATSEATDTAPLRHDGVAPPAPDCGGARDEAARPETERRQAERHAYPHRVVALGEQATRVLLGRDISMGGMRVDNSSGLALGDELQLALHTNGRSEPLIVRARVTRDAGEDGLVLVFDALCEPASSDLEQLVENLPLLAGDEEDEQAAGVVISEILDRRAV